MEITYDQTLIEEMGDDRKVYFTLTDDHGQSYQWHVDVPVEIENIQAYLSANAEDFLLLIRRREYPGSPDFNDLSEMEQWIAAGIDVPVKVPWVGTHPVPSRVIDGKKVSLTTKNLLDNAADLEALKNVLKKILFGEE